MRGVLLLLLAGCTLSRHANVDPDEIDGDGRCRSDRGCDDGEVCARNGGCYPPSQLRAVTVTWTIDGMPADSATCAKAPDLLIGFDANGGGSPLNHVEFAPVPCYAGRFSIDKLPIGFTEVHLGNERARDSQRAELDAATGQVAIDLAF